MCLHYPPALKALTFVKEILITQCHPVILILKLRLNGTSSSVPYQCVCGYTVVFL